MAYNMFDVWSDEQKAMLRAESDIEAKTGKNPVVNFISRYIFGNSFTIDDRLKSAQYKYMRLGQLATSEIFYERLGKPDAMLGILPLYSVQYLEVGRSQDILEFRSIGAEFLAQQKGGHVGVRIDFILTGPTKNFIINILRFMVEWEKVREFGAREDAATNTPVNRTVKPDTLKKELRLNTIATSQSFSLTNTAGGSIIGDINPGVSPFVFGCLGNPSLVSVMSNLVISNRLGLPSSVNVHAPTEGLLSPDGKIIERGGQLFEFDYTKSNIEGVETLDTISEQDMMLKKATEENVRVGPRKSDWSKVYWHNTFTLMTAYDIMFDMFIETFKYSYAVKDGKDVAMCSLLLRQFRPDAIPKNSQLKGISSTKYTDKQVTHTKPLQIMRFTETENIVQDIQRKHAFKKLWEKSLSNVGSKMEDYELMLGFVHGAIRTVSSWLTGGYRYMQSSMTFDQYLFASRVSKDLVRLKL